MTSKPLTPIKTRFLAKVKKVDSGCWEWTGSLRATYGKFWLGTKMLSAHRVSYELHIGKIPNGMCVCHRCDNRICVNPKHLFLGTYADNVADREAKGRSYRPGLRGMDRKEAKLTNADVVAIRASNGVAQDTLAKRYGVNQGLISRIKSGKAWSHVQWT